MQQIHAAVSACPLQQARRRGQENAAARRVQAFYRGREVRWQLHYVNGMVKPIQGLVRGWMLRRRLGRAADAAEREDLDDDELEDGDGDEEDEEDEDEEDEEDEEEDEEDEDEDEDGGSTAESSDGGEDVEAMQRQHADEDAELEMLQVIRWPSQLRSPSLL